MEITLIFPSCGQSIKTHTPNVIDELKTKAFDTWKAYVKQKENCDAAFDEILPSGSTPISLGQLCLVSSLRKNGIRVNYVHSDYFLVGKGYSVEMLKSHIADVSKNSQFVGIYAMTPMINSALDILEYVKTRNSKTITIIGGPHATYMDVDILKEHSYVDIVSRGEGEATLLALLQGYDYLADRICAIDGITYRKGDKIIRNKDQALLMPKDIPSPDYSVLPTDFNFLCTVMYSRGCPYSCKFCAEGGLWRHKVRFRDAAVVAEEIRQIYTTRHQKVIHIADSEIDANPKQLEVLLDEIIKLNIDCKYTVNLRCDAYKRLTPQLIDKMKKAGFFGYLVGVESASDYMLELMGRRSTFDDFIKTIDLLNENHAGYILPGVMLGFPGETKDPFEQTKNTFLRLLKEERVSYFFPKVFVPYPGSEPFQNPEAYGITISKKWDDYSRFDVKQIFESAHITEEYLSEAMLDFYNQIVCVLDSLQKKYEKK